MSFELMISFVFMIWLLGLTYVIESLVRRLKASEIMIQKLMRGLVTKGIISKERMLQIIDEPLRENENAK